METLVYVTFGGKKGSQSDSWLKALMAIHGLQVEAGLFAKGHDLEGPSDWRIKVLKVTCWPKVSKKRFNEHLVSSHGCGTKPGGTKH